MKRQTFDKFWCVNTASTTIKVTKHPSPQKLCPFPSLTLLTSAQQPCFCASLQTSLHFLEFYMNDSDGLYPAYVIYAKFPFWLKALLRLEVYTRL